MPPQLFFDVASPLQCSVIRVLHAVQLFVGFGPLQMRYGKPLPCPMPGAVVQPAGPAWLLSIASSSTSHLHHACMACMLDVSHAPLCFAKDFAPHVLHAAADRRAPGLHSPALGDALSCKLAAARCNGPGA